MLEARRSCSECGGIVHVMTIDKPQDRGESMPTKIGACLRCGKWFNEAGLLELTRLPAPPPDEQRD